MGLVASRDPYLGPFRIGMKTIEFQAIESIERCD